MSWQDRIEPELLMESPLGSSFSALWRGDAREMKKKLGIFEFPGLVGAEVQDLQVGAVFEPLSFFFEGRDHDIQAEKFWQACKELGHWTVDHPTKGRVALQLMSVKEDIQPVESGNNTGFKTEWIEPLGATPTESTAQQAAAINGQSTTVQAKANEQAEAAVDVEKPSSITQFKTAIRSSATLVKAALEPLTRTAAEVNAQVEAVDRAITASLSEAVFSVTSLAGQVQTMVMLPGQIEGDLVTRLSYYTALLESAVNLSDEEQATVSVNGAAVRETVAVTALAAMAEIAADSTPQTRSEAIAALVVIDASYHSAIDSMDANQGQLGGEYVSQASSFNDSALLIADVIRLLLTRSFDLAAAKIIQLSTHRAPVEIAITEGVDLDQFISTNELKDVDVLLLPPGREVVVYL